MNSHAEYNDFIWFEGLNLIVSISIFVVLPFF